MRIGGLGISDFCNLSVRRARTWLDEVRLTDTERRIVWQALWDRLVLVRNDERGTRNGW